MWSPSSPVTGLALTGLTNPTYTLTADVAPNQNGKQHAITTLGGTQTGVNSHSVANPFTASFFRPASFKQLGVANPVTGIVGSVPMNVFKLIVRKGVLPLAGQPRKPMMINIAMEVPAGADLADAVSIAAALSCVGGLVSAEIADIYDSIVTGVI